MPVEGLFTKWGTLSHPKVAHVMTKPDVEVSR